jgi:hypothetical protein
MTEQSYRGFEPKEMYRVWRTGALIEDFENFDSYDSDLDEPTAAGPTGARAGAAHASLHPALAPAPAPAAPKKVIDVIIPTSLAQANRQSAVAAGKGKLSQLLSKERSALQATAPSAVPSRFRGVYQRTVAQAAVLPPVSVSAAAAAAQQAATSSALDHILGPAPASSAAAGNKGPNSSNTAATGAVAAGAANKDEAVDAPVVCHTQVAKILRNPFAPTGTILPQAHAKRNKKNLTFALVSAAVLPIACKHSYLV